MFSAYTLNKLANLCLAASFIALIASVSIELSNWSTTEASEPEYTQTIPADAAKMWRAADFSMFKPDSDLAPEQLLLNISHASFGQSVPLSVPKPDVQAGAARVPTAPTEGKLAALPTQTGIIFEDLGKKVCIGGTQCPEHCRIETGGCEVRPAYVIKLQRPAYIAAVQLYGHDQVGPTRRAALLVKVNGEPAGKAVVHRFGSTLTVKVGRVGQLVTVESMHDSNGFLYGGEETVIWDVYLFGREPR
jgi:hypothetical protein